MAGSNRVACRVPNRYRYDANQMAVDANVIGKELERVIQKKARKRYIPKLTFVVWLNLDKQEIEESDVVAVFEDTRRKYAGSFEKIFILWRGKVL